MKQFPSAGQHRGWGLKHRYSAEATEPYLLVLRLMTLLLLHLQDARGRLARLCQEFSRRNTLMQELNRQGLLKGIFARGEKVVLW